MEKDLDKFLGMIAEGMASSGIKDLKDELNQLNEKDESNQKKIEELKAEAERLRPSGPEPDGVPDLKTIHDILYDEIHGVCTNLRDHKFDTLTKEKMDKIIRFTGAVNLDLRSGKVDPQAIVMIIDLLSFIHNLDGAPDNSVYMDQYFDRYLDFYNDVTFELIKGI